MDLGAALFAGLENFTASRLGVSAYFVRGIANEINRGLLALPLEDEPVPATWKEIVLVETSTAQAENFSGLLESNPDVLTGERPTERAFIVRQFYFAEPPTIDDRIILIATGQNLSIAGVDPESELEKSAMVYRLLCRVLD